MTNIDDVLQTPVPTTRQLAAVLADIRSQLGDPHALVFPSSSGMHEWHLDGPRRGPRIVISPLFPTMLSWTVRVDCFCPQNSPLSALRFMPFELFELSSSANRTRMVEHIVRAHQIWADIVSIPGRPIGLARTLEPLLHHADEVFSWEQESERYKLRVRGAAALLLRQHAVVSASPDSAAPPTAPPAAAAHLEMLTGLSGVYIDVIMDPGHPSHLTIPGFRFAGDSIGQEMARWRSSGVAERTECLPPKQIARRFVSALVVSEQLRRGAA